MAFMYRSLYSKFAQNEVIHEQLMQTGNRYLIYATDDDKTWGIGIDRSGKWNNIYNNDIYIYIYGSTTHADKGINKPTPVLPFYYIFAIA